MEMVNEIIDLIQRIAEYAGAEAVLREERQDAEKRLRILVIIERFPEMAEALKNL